MLSRELRALQQCCSPHILHYYGAMVSEYQVSLILEYMDRGSLSDVVKLYGPLPEPMLGKVAWNVLILAHLPSHINPTIGSQWTGILERSAEYDTSWFEAFKYFGKFCRWNKVVRLWWQCGDDQLDGWFCCWNDGLYGGTRLIIHDNFLILIFLCSRSDLEEVRIM